MKNFKLTAEITISLYTEVEAETLEEAIAIAEERDLMAIVGTGGDTKNDTWMADELDGMPKNITEA
jgi:predicted metal-dependent TIM-barrel fold hydrolase